MPDTKTPRLNILLITSDQQHYSTLGSVNPLLRTPALDDLARQGTRFDRAYCPNPTCSPTRASIITGLYPSVHGCWTLGTMLPLDTPTVGGYLAENGYATGLIGKAHFEPTRATPSQPSIESMPRLRDLDFWKSFHGPRYGFERFEVARMHADEHLVGSHYALWMQERGLNDWQAYFDPWPPRPDAPKRRHRWDLPERFHYNVWTAERTIEHIDQCVSEGKPFFTWASFHDPHPPYLVPAPWDTMYRSDDMPIGRLQPGELQKLPPHFGMTQGADVDWSSYQQGEFANHGFHSHVHDDSALKQDMAIYYGMVSFMDQQIGAILKHLDETGLADNTLVVFTSDHGHFLGQHGLIAKGAFHFEDVLRVPMIVRCPGRVPAGVHTTAMQSLVDFTPTFLTATGLDVPASMQGVNQWEVWQGKVPRARDHVIVENRHTESTIHLRTMIQDRYKITVYRGHRYGELFDLLNDPDELVNLWDDPESAGIKSNMLQEFLSAEMEREPTPRPRIAFA